MLSNATPFGGSKDSLGIAYIVVAGICLITAIVLGLMAVFREQGKKPDIKYPPIVIRSPRPPKFQSCVPRKSCVCVVCVCVCVSVSELCAS